MDLNLRRIVVKLTAQAKGKLKSKPKTFKLTL